MSEEKKLNGTVIVTYRCNARCSMCNRYKAPSKPEEEISIETIEKHKTTKLPYYQLQQFLNFPTPPSPRIFLMKKACTSQAQQIKRKSA